MVAWRRFSLVGFDPYWTVLLAWRFGAASGPCGSTDAIEVAVLFHHCCRYYCGVNHQICSWPPTFHQNKLGRGLCAWQPLVFLLWKECIGTWSNEFLVGVDLVVCQNQFDSLAVHLATLAVAVPIPPELGPVVVEIVHHVSALWPRRPCWNPSATLEIVRFVADILVLAQRLAGAILRPPPPCWVPQPAVAVFAEWCPTAPPRTDWQRYRYHFSTRARHRASWVRVSQQPL